MQQKKEIKQENLQEIKVIITNVEALKMPAKKTAFKPCKYCPSPRTCTAAKKM